MLWSLFLIRVGPFQLKISYHTFLENFLEYVFDDILPSIFCSLSGTPIKCMLHLQAWTSNFSNFYFHFLISVFFICFLEEFLNFISQFFYLDFNLYHNILRFQKLSFVILLFLCPMSSLTSLKITGMPHFIVLCNVALY